MRGSATACAAVLAAALAAGPAAAGNWTLTGTAFERLSADSNLRLEEDNEGALIGSTTGVELDLGYDARRTEWSLGSGLRFREFWGPGDAEGLEGFSDPRLEGGVVHRSTRQTLQAGGRVSRQPVAFTRLEEAEAGRSDDEAIETRAALNARWTRQATPRLNHSIGIAGDVRRFSEEAGDLTPSESLSIDAGVLAAIDPRTSAGLTARASTFTSENDSREIRSRILSLGANLVRRPTPRLSYDATASIGRRWTDRTTRTEILPFLTLVDETEETGLTFSGAFDLDWRATPRTTVAVNAVQALESGAEGDLTNTTRLGTTLRQRLTPRSGLTLGANWSRRTTEVSFEGTDSGAEDDDDASELFRITARLDTDLTRRWDAGLGLDLRLRRTDEEDARSAGVFFEVRRDLVLNR